MNQNNNIWVQYDITFTFIVLVKSLVLRILDFLEVYPTAVTSDSNLVPSGLWEKGWEETKQVDF